MKRPSPKSAEPPRGGEARRGLLPILSREEKRNGCKALLAARRTSRLAAERPGVVAHVSSSSGASVLKTGHQRMTAKRGIGFIVATKRDRPFAVLVIRGTDSISDFDAVELTDVPPPLEPGENPNRPVFQAVNYALGQLGLDPRELAAAGWAEPDIQVAPIGDDVTYDELRERWRQSVGATADPGVNVIGRGSA